MTPIQFPRHARNRLLCGIPALILATALLPSQAAAQAHQIDSEGRILLTTDQRSQGSGVTAVTTAPPASVRTGATEDADIGVTGNTLAATASANAATATLARDVTGGTLWPSRVTIQSDAVDAEGAIFISTRQALVRSPVQANAAPAGLTIATDATEHSRIAIDANTIRAESRGNDHLASLSLAGEGGGVAVLQAADGSQMFAAQSGILSVLSDAVTASSLGISGNRQQAVAAANSTDVSLMTVGPVSLIADTGPTTSVDNAGTVSVRAANPIAQRQSSAGATLASAGAADPSGALIYATGATGSSLTVSGNSLASNGTANRASGVLSVSGPGITGFGAGAANLIAQQADGQVISTTTGRHQTHVAGPVSGSTLSATGNVVRADAAGNVADTAMDVRATTISAFGGPASGPVGTALVNGTALRSTTAPFAVHSDQRTGPTSITAGSRHSGVSIAVDGAVAGSRIEAAGNAQAAQAIANDSSAGLNIDAGLFASSADLLLVQSSQADAGSDVGAVDDLAGVSIAPSASITQSTILLSGNSLESLSGGNRASNRLELAAGSADGGGHDRSRAGEMDSGYGASATLALSSVQTVGMLGALPDIMSRAYGRFAVTGNGDVSGSSITIENSDQRATVIANTVENALTLSAATTGDTGTALSSSQFGATTVHAGSSMRIVAPGNAVQSSVQILGNANRASASMNEATNRLVIEGGASDGIASTTVSATMLGDALSEGRHVLNNAQFAMGSLDAAAATLIAGSTATAEDQPGLVGTTLRLAGNTTLAEGSANRAFNALDLGSASSGGIASSQFNTASVSALSRTDVFLGTPRADQKFVASSVTVEDNGVLALARGNLVENQLSLDSLSAADARTQVTGTKARALAPTAIASTQVNYGAITASATGSGFSVPLNGTAVAVSDVRLSGSGNSVAATAYANGAANSVALPAGSNGSGIALVTSQINYAPVLARVTGGSTSLATGDLRQSSLAVSNSSVLATATGNIATNLVGPPR